MGFKNSGPRVGPVVKNTACARFAAPLASAKGQAFGRKDNIYKILFALYTLLLHYNNGLPRNNTTRLSFKGRVAQAA